jgi:[ribosomal protein S5]-alanine N-acetyltransferase
MRVELVKPTKRHAAELMAAGKRSRKLHGRFGSVPQTPEVIAAYLAKLKKPQYEGWLVVEKESGALTGMINLNEIVRGGCQGAYMGYFAFAPHAGMGYMTEGMTLAIHASFGALKLHRLEANIQPENVASIALVKRLGFRKEGLSKKYLKIGGRWRDHERWALLKEEWRA